MKYILSLVYLMSLITSVSIFSNSSTSALLDGVILLQVQTASPTSASDEIIVLYNLSENPVNITNWCINYSSSSDVTKKKLACVEPIDPQTEIYLQEKGIISFSSGEFVISNPGYVPDYLFSAGLAATSGHVWITDSAGLEIDRLGWGTAVKPEGVAALAHTAGKTISRDYLDTVIDSDDNSTDFSSLTLINPITSDIYEQSIVVDVCPNIDELQIEIPNGYMQDSDGSCQVDFCPNLDDLQVESPFGYEKILGSDDCSEIPLESAVLLITELLANASSTDTGNEYIEIYNPNNRVIELNGYKLQVGPAFTKDFVLTSGNIQPNEYLIFSDTQSKIVLPNTTGVQLRLIAPAGNLVAETPTYSNSSDDVTWAVVNDQWIYTNQPTPGAANQPYQEPVVDEVIGITTVYAPCPAGKYRNPETNRCKAIETALSALTSCDEDEYRNPETNRCRKIVAASTLATCPVGQERNPETNRCRKVSVLGASTDEIATITDVAVESTAGQINWPVILIAVLGTFGYIFYEWRNEMRQAYSRMRIKLVQ